MTDEQYADLVASVMSLATQAANEAGSERRTSLAGAARDIARATRDLMAAASIRATGTTAIPYLPNGTLR